MSSPPLVFSAPPLATLAVTNSAARFPIRRIYCVARNYVAHAQEMGGSGREAPFFFLKPADAALAVDAQETGRLPYPSLTHDLHHEVELVVALGKGGTDIAVAQAAQHIYGYAVGLDMTRRDLQQALKKEGRPWCIAKGFEASAPIGAITPVAQAGDLAQAHIELQINGQTRQHGVLQDMIWNVAEIIAQLSQAWTLAPGDLIFTGTPSGVGPVKRGDRLRAEITGLAALSLEVV